MIHIAHNLQRPFTFDGFNEHHVTPAELAGLLGSMMKRHRLHSQVTCSVTGIISFVFYDGYALNVQGTSAA